MQKFSVCMAVYGGDHAEDFKKAVFSIYEQTVRPDEIIIVVDGPVPDPVAKVIADLESAIDIIRVIWSAESSAMFSAVRLPPMLSSMAFENRLTNSSMPSLAAFIISVSLITTFI